MSIPNERVLYGYIDDSKHPLADVICAAGYLFEPAMARRFGEVWKRFVELKRAESPAKPDFYFHATDAIRRSDAQEIFSRLASVTKQTALRGFVEFTTPTAMAAVHESVRKYVGSAYSMTTLGCMKLMADAAKERHSSVVYFIEEGNQFAGELRHFLHQIKGKAEMVDMFAMADAGTYSKKDIIQLQAADLFAWSFSRSQYIGRWAESIIDLVQDKAVEHTLQMYDPVVQAMINSVNGLSSNRTNFDD